MAIPSFQEITLPLLQIAADGQTRSLVEVRPKLARYFKLTDEEEDELLPRGKQKRFPNHVAWAKVYLERGGLLESPERGQFKITLRGLEVLKSPPSSISVKFLKQFSEYTKFQSQPKMAVSTDDSEDEDIRTPEVALGDAYQSIRTGLALELLTQVKSSPPEFFERLVVDLLLKMGYGRAGGNGKAIGKTGDEGIDGIIAEDRLGLEMVYLQAKRWEGTVGRPEIQRFVGALHGRRARKGVFITTSSFSAEATNYVQTIDPKVALIDGAQLVEFMIDFNIGVSTYESYEVKKIDSDYFEE